MREIDITKHDRGGPPHDPAIPLPPLPASAGADRRRYPVRGHHHIISRRRPGGIKQKFRFPSPENRGMMGTNKTRRTTQWQQCM